MTLYFSESGIAADEFLEVPAGTDDTVKHNTNGKITDEPECGNDAFACAQLGQTRCEGPGNDMENLTL